MDARDLARLATQIENGAFSRPHCLKATASPTASPVRPARARARLVDALTAELRRREKTVAIVAVDPSSRATGGAILGDRVRMQRHHSDPGVFIRSMATRGATGGLARTSSLLSRLFRSAGFDSSLSSSRPLAWVRTQIDIAGLADVTVVILVPGMGDDIQQIKAGVMERSPTSFVINKADRPGVDQLQHHLETHLPVFRTIATDGTGIPELVIDLEARPRGQHAQTLNWSIDHLGIAVRSNR